MPNLQDSLIYYDCESKNITFLTEVEPIIKIALKNAVIEFKDKLEKISNSDIPQVYFTEYFYNNSESASNSFRLGFLCPEPHKKIYIIFSDITVEKEYTRQITQLIERDELTGLYQKDAFCRRVDTISQNDKAAIADGKYIMLYFDILHFKAVNDIFGKSEGDKLLSYIANYVSGKIKGKGFACRLGGDRFCVFAKPLQMDKLEETLLKFLEKIKGFMPSFKVICNIGVYVTNNELLVASEMIARAILAQAAIKGSYISSINFYTEELRSALLSEQEIVGMMGEALSEKQFVIYFQPQYEHSTKMLVGAEALVRWIHPTKGIISPADFIPIFEKNGFITDLDLYVFSQTCAFQKKCLESKMRIVPISINFSRNDIFAKNIVEEMEKIRSMYDVPAKYLRIEITETSMAGESSFVNQVIKKMHSYGYIVEMDDFGSGYSSLNTLKDVSFDIVKLDMRFLSHESGSNRGGTILSSVIRMAKWLRLPVIAEGVETLEQADFLRSIGCDYIQGYLYSRPLPQFEFESILKENKIGSITQKAKLMETFNATSFWNPESLETLIFSNYVGAAALFDYRDGKLEIIRVNQKYVKEMGMGLTEKEILTLEDPFCTFDEENKKIYIDMIERAIVSEQEEECETWRTIPSNCCDGTELMCFRTQIIMLGKSEGNIIFYAMVRNITREKNLYRTVLDAEKRFKIASEQANIYYWEYDFLSKEMKPCFRCIRDLKCPSILRNFPESALELGIINKDSEKQYLELHEKLKSGVKELEVVLPFTNDGSLFKIRYTTDFDSSGKPIKAYGSAIRV